MVPPIGTPLQPFTGSFEGNGKQIANWVYYGGSVALFAATQGGSIRDLVLSGIEVGGSVSVGGLVGMCNGAVTGGVVGYLGSGSAVTDSYATGSVLSYGSVNGGFVAIGDGAISRCYSTASIAGSGPNTGGFGYTRGGVTSAYWDIEASGATMSLVGVGKTTAEMKDQSTFVGWDFATVWQLAPGSYPTLR